MFSHHQTTITAGGRAQKRGPKPPQVKSLGVEPALAVDHGLVVLDAGFDLRIVCIG